MTAPCAQCGQWTEQGDLVQIIYQFQVVLLCKTCIPEVEKFIGGTIPKEENENLG